MLHEQQESPERRPADDILEKSIVFYGGGPRFGGPGWSTPRLYGVALYYLLGQLEHAEWQDWWRQSGQLRCDIFHEVGSERTRCKITRSQRRVNVLIERRIDDVVDKRNPPDPGAEAAIEDVDRLVRSLRDRFTLQAPPKFIPPNPVEVFDAEHDAAVSPTREEDDHRPR